MAQSIVCNQLKNKDFLPCIGQSLWVETRETLALQRLQGVPITSHRTAREPHLLIVNQRVHGPKRL